MLLRSIAVAAVLFVPIAEASALQCGSYSGVSRRCFFSFYKPCLAEGLSKKACSAQDYVCHSCSDRLFACWKTLKSRNQCDKCIPAYDACMHKLIKSMKP